MQTRKGFVIDLYLTRMQLELNSVEDEEWTMIVRK